MIAQTVYVKRWSAWAPGLETSEAQKAWAAGQTTIRNTTEAPPLTFLPPLFRRRLSQLNRMVLQVGHELLKNGEKPPCIFASRYGEITKQYLISRALLDSGEVSPGNFSLSVFNTSLFLFSIAEGINEPGSALFSGDQEVVSALVKALSLLRRPGGKECLVLFGDEAIPPAYRSLFQTMPDPYAFGLFFSLKGDPAAPEWVIELNDNDRVPVPRHPLQFLRWLLVGDPNPITLPGPGVLIRIRRNS